MSIPSHHEALRALLTQDSRDVIDLPYTETFDRVHGQFQRITGQQIDKHDLWVAVVELAGRIPSSSSTGSTVSQSSSLADDLTAFPDARRAVEDYPESLFDLEAVHQASADSAPEQTATGKSLVPSLPASSLPSTDAASNAEIDTPSADSLATQRAELMTAVANSLFGTTEQRVAYILQTFPETRDDDIALCIRYWNRFQADVIERSTSIGLDVLHFLDRGETISRLKREIQNTLGLFRGKEGLKSGKSWFKKELADYLAMHKGTPEIRFYLDETGNEGDKALVGVGGVAVINWRQYEKHHSALSQWRREQNWPEPFHFSEARNDTLDRAVRFLGEIQRRRSGLLFLGYTLRSRAQTAEELFTLYVQLISDSIAHIQSLQSLPDQALVRVIKENDEGFDKFWLPKMKDYLVRHLDDNFGSRLELIDIEVMEKGRDCLLECADLLAGAMQRRVLYRGDNPKDRLTMAAFSMSGFGDTKDPGVVYKIH